MTLEADIHKIAKKYLTKKKQGYFMGEIRAMLPPPVEYDRDLISDMLISYSEHAHCDKDLEHLESSIIDQSILLKKANDADAAGVHTAMPPTDHAA